MDANRVRHLRRAMQKISLADQGGGHHEFPVSEAKYRGVPGPRPFSGAEVLLST